MLRVTVKSNTCRAVGKALPGDVDALLNQVANGIESDWRGGVRVSANSEPGHVHYRDTIDMAKIDDGYAVESPKEYAPFEEFGTRKMRGSHAAAQAASHGRTELEQGAKGLLA